MHTERRPFEYRYRKGNFEDISANNTQTAKREKRNPQKVYAIAILGKGKGKNEIKKQNVLNSRQLAFKKERNPEDEYTRNIAYTGMLAAMPGHY